jgi:hypothetical protein
MSATHCPDDPDEQSPKPPAPKDRKEIPLVSVPDDRDIADDMAEIFDEDRVTHQHGSTEPEAD